MMLVMQLLIRPRDSLSFIIRIEESLPPPVVRSAVGMSEITATVNNCVKGLMDLRDIVAFARLNGGADYAPVRLGFAVNPNDKDQYDRPRAVEFGALIKKVIYGHVADNLASYFRPNLADPSITPARPDFSGTNKPKDWEGMIEAVLQIYEYYRFMSEAMMRLHLDYEGCQAGASTAVG